MCKKSGETLDHLLFHYDIARELSNLVLDVGAEWIMPRQVGGAFAVLERKVLSE
jgi:hypothetical protein